MLCATWLLRLWLMQALEFLVPIAQIGSWGSFRQDVAETYVRGLPLISKTILSDEAQPSSLLRELVQGSELGYRSAVIHHLPSTQMLCCQMAIAYVLPSRCRLSTLPGF